MIFKKFTTSFIAAGIASALFLSSCNSGGNAPTAKTEMILTQEKDSIAPWFVGDKITKNGVVKPADSLVTLESDADFHLWSWQMFLWLMSKDDKAFVFDSAGFFDLSETNELLANGTDAKNVRFIRNGQAGMMAHGVLMSQDKAPTKNGSLVYYGIHVNDTFAYYVSGQKNNNPAIVAMKDFPTTKPELKVIEEYAKKAYGAEITTPEALAMEMKSSWVEIDDEKVGKEYITTKAFVPVYKKDSAGKKWTWDGKTRRQALLAMVGFHVVGSTAKHPEMVWATFEHEKNSPNANYKYEDHGKVREVKNFTSAGLPIESDWLFYDAKTNMKNANIMNMTLSTTNSGSTVIKAEPSKSISAGSTYRISPYGNKPTEAKKNTLLRNINKSIRGQLKSGDARKEYFLVGSIWTENGVPGVNNSVPIFAGSTKLANSTLETYTQYNNCFDCHTTQKGLTLSHIAPVIQPLPLPKK